MNKLALCTITIFILAITVALAQADSGSPASQYYLGENVTDDADLTYQQPAIKTVANGIEKIEIGVETCQLRTISTNDSGRLITRHYRAATASRKNAKLLPYGKVGRIRKIVFNPDWVPPDSIREEVLKKTGKILPKRIPQGKGNPLGKVKMLIAYGNEESSLRIHSTDAPNSIGKRVSHGCNRLGKTDAFKITRPILENEGLDADEIFARAKANPKKQIEIPIKNGPAVVYLKK